ncbi:MAG: CBS domain-containing protein [Parvularculaceae bacterium]|nr:CBS domain-containing protein [Parvularculaceae bacterium]
MKVEHILQSKGRDVVTIAATAEVAEAVAVLSEKNIGAVVVKEGAVVVGILSERDIVRRLKHDGADALVKIVRTYMTPNPVVCRPDHELDEILEIMTRRRVRHLPVMRDGVLLGMVSIGDVVKRKIEIAEEEARALKDYIAS